MNFHVKYHLARQTGSIGINGHWSSLQRHHIVDSCPLTKFDGGLLHLHEADEAAVDWLTTYGS